MNFLEYLRVAVRALKVNKMRSALTVLGIVVAVAAVVCMVSVGSGAISPATQSQLNAIMSECGKGHDWLEK